jgi:hypothetical protein
VIQQPNAELIAIGKGVLSASNPVAIGHKWEVVVSTFLNTGAVDQLVGNRVVDN